MSDNPYLPPTAETDVPDAPQSHGWMVKDGYLLVEPNAQLPMVDLFTGETADRMILHAMKITRMPFWMIGLFWTAVGLTTVSILLGNAPLVTVTGPLAFLSGLATAIGAILTRSFTLKSLFTRESSRKITLLSRSATILGITLMVSFLTMTFVDLDISLRTRKAIGVAIVVGIVVRIIVPFFFRRLTCRRSMGSHLEIRGVHPVALERLRELRQG